MQKWTKKWTDDELYEKYSITKDEIAFIESIVRPMDASDEAEEAGENEDE